MADQTVVHIGEDSAEKIAYQLFQHIVDVEKFYLHPDAKNGKTTADRKWILDTYAECLRAVTMPQNR